MSIKKRKYKNYNDYLHHQSMKLTIGVRNKIEKFMPSHFPNAVISFEKRIGEFKEYVKPCKILCLGSRSGAEVVAFRNLGFNDTIGIDINPGKDNKYVIKGDFHNMDFKDKTFNTIYCNCIDHAWSLKELSKEIRRVLVSNGRLILEIDHTIKKKREDRVKQVKKKSKYESIMWEDVKDLEKGLKGFKVISRFDSACPTFMGIILDEE